MKWNTIVRVAMVVLGGVVLALVAPRVVGTTIELGALMAVPLGAAGGLLSASTGRLRWVRRFVAAGAAVVGAAVVGSVIGGGSAADGPIGLVRGPRQVLTTEWPSPRWSTILAALAGVVALATFVAVAMAIDRRWRVAPALPLIVGGAALTAASARADSAWLLAAPLGLIVAVLALVRAGRSARLSLRSLLGVATAAALATSVVVVNLGATRRDPRSLRPPDAALAVLDPVGETIAQAAAGEDLELFRVAVSGGTLPEFWRTAGLERYDGQAWRVGEDLRPLGRQVDEARGEVSRRVTIDVLRSDQRLVVSPGRVLTSDVSLRSDTNRSLFTIEPGERPARIDLEAVITEPVVPGSGATLAQIAPTDLEATFTQTARTLAGTGSLADQIDRLAARMLDDYVLDDTVGGGLQLALVDRFVNDTRVGTTEQFVTAFVLMARSLGADARLATGYFIEPDSGSSTTIVAADAAMWAEVRLDSGEYRTLDVTPLPREAVEPPALPDSGQAPPAVQPPEPPQAEEVADDDDPVEIDAPAAPSWWERARPYVIGVSLGLGGLVAAVCLFVLAVMIAKARRRRGLRHGPPAERIHRAWLVASDELVDADVPLEDNVTTADISAAGARAFPQIEAPIGTLSTLADRAVFSTRPCEPEHADFAVALLADVQTGLRQHASVRERVRRTVTPRSLSRRRGSPLRRRLRAPRRQRGASRPTARR